MTEQTGLTVLEEDQMVLPPRPEFSANAYIKSMEEYEALYKRSIEDPNGFWAEIAEKELTWFKKWDKVLDYDFNKPYIKWFQGGKLNASYNCLDRHLDTWRKNKAAIIWEADDGTSKTYTYQQLHREVNRFANVLKKKGVKRGDRVSLYLPMIPELAIAMLACARIGAIHSVVFGGFSSQALRDRIQDCEAKVLVVADNGMRGGRVVPLKKNSDAALEQCPSIQSVIVVNRAGDTEMKEGRDTWWHEEMAANDISSYCEPEHMDAEDPLFILYTSGSTGKPKGVLHTTGGYTLYTALTFRLTFDYKEEQTHFCTADIGWVTGHSYVVYGPLTCGATSIMFEGVPSYPDAGRFWDIIDKYQVNIFYTAPTAIRALMKEGDGWVEKYDLSSLKVLGTVGEPINPAAFMWYYNKVGKSKLPIVDTYWQTETGGFLITPLPGAMTLKPGSATRPFFGVEPKVVKEDGSPAPVDEQGYLVIDKPWPGMLRGTYGDPENARIKEVYFSRFPGKYFTGDGARVDRDGDFWITGRIDDVINVSGHRLGTAEVESALVSHPSVAEAAVVGFPHDIKGEGIYAYVTLKDGFKPSPELKKELVTHVRTIIGPIASPDKMQFAPGLPKTRSGKIMRRIL
ncbi:MAG: acetate--CoA ligase, partial [Candidatus Aquicultor secundus]